MDVASKVLAVIAALAQLAAIYLLVQQARAANRELKLMDGANRGGYVGGTYGSQKHHYQATRRLLGDQAHPQLAVALLVVGTLAGLGSSLLG